MTLELDCTIAGTRGRTLRTQSSVQSPAGSTLVAVADVDGHVVHQVTDLEWGDPATAQAAMAALWTAVGDGETVTPGYGTEIVWTLPAGEVRASSTGAHVRVLDADGAEVDEGSAYWVVDEWIEAPAEVMGAVLGAAAALRG